jgi:hypothetical protein
MSMYFDRSARTFAALLCLCVCGCSVAREIPASEYAAQPERHDVKVVTRSGEKYEFDRARIAADSLYGYQSVDTEGSFEQYRIVNIGLDQVVRLSVRGVDWYRTGLIGGVAAAAVLAAVLSQQAKGSGGDSGGGNCGGRPCP